MSANKIQKILDAMDPEEALAALALAAKKLFPLLGEESRRQFLLNLGEDSGEDKVVSMVHL
jgi:hypothetical protein